MRGTCSSPSGKDEAFGRYIERGGINRTWTVWVVGEREREWSSKSLQFGSALPRRGLDMTKNRAGPPWQFLTKINIFLPYKPAIVLLGIYPKSMSAKTCTWILTAV